MKSNKLRQSAEGQDCTLRLFGCKNDVTTVCLAHAPGTGMKGMRQKCPDIFSMYACYHCHAVIDGREKGEWEYRDIVRAMAETQMIFINLGLVKVL